MTTFAIATSAIFISYVVLLIISAALNFVVSNYVFYIARTPLLRLVEIGIVVNLVYSINTDFIINSFQKVDRTASTVRLQLSRKFSTDDIKSKIANLSRTTSKEISMTAMPTATTITERTESVDFVDLP
jgi:hypothetical protein